MSFISGVWRLLGAGDDITDEEQIVEYPGRNGKAGRVRQSASEERLLSTAEHYETTMFVVRPELGEKGEPLYSLKRYASILLTRRALVLDINQLVGSKLDEATHVVDYLSGVLEAVDGSVFEVTKNVFIFSPGNVQLAGDPLNKIEVQ